MAINPRLLQSMNEARRRMDIGGIPEQRHRQQMPSADRMMQAVPRQNRMQQPMPGMMRQQMAPQGNFQPQQNMIQEPTVQRPYNPQVGREMNRQIAEMRLVGDDGQVRDPRFTRFQADVIRRRIYGIQRQNFINGEISANDMANTENYLNSVSDDEVVQNYPMFFDTERDGAYYVNMSQAAEAYARQREAVDNYRRQNEAPMGRTQYMPGQGA